MQLTEKARKDLQKIVEEDLRDATTTSVSIVLSPVGTIEIEEIALRLNNGREVVISRGDIGTDRQIAAFIRGGEGWREMEVAYDYADEADELEAAEQDARGRS
ncbi:MAG: hypothetical protein WBK67_01935 [Minisyncoccales bacterium]